MILGGFPEDPWALRREPTHIRAIPPPAQPPPCLASFFSDSPLAVIPEPAFLPWDTLHAAWSPGLAQVLHARPDSLFSVSLSFSINASVSLPAPTAGRFRGPGGPGGPGGRASELTRPVIHPLPLAQAAGALPLELQTREVACEALSFLSFLTRFPSFFSAPHLLPFYLSH